MKNKRAQFLALTLASIGAVGAFSSVSAASVASGTPETVRDQVHTAMKQAFTADDYQAYLAVTKDHPSKMPVLTEEQFHAMVQAQKLRASGDTAGAQKVLDAAGIKPPTHGKKGKHGDRDREDMMSNLTDAQKATLAQAKTLFEAGKITEGQALLDSAGIKMPMERFHEKHENEKHGNSKIKSTIKNWFKGKSSTGTTTNQ